MSEGRIRVSSGNSNWFQFSNSNKGPTRAKKPKAYEPRFNSSRDLAASAERDERRVKEVRQKQKEAKKRREDKEKQREEKSKPRPSRIPLPARQARLRRFIAMHFSVKEICSKPTFPLRLRVETNQECSMLQALAYQSGVIDYLKVTKEDIPELFAGYDHVYVAALCEACDAEESSPSPGNKTAKFQQKILKCLRYNPSEK